MPLIKAFSVGDGTDLGNVSEGDRLLPLLPPGEYNLNLTETNTVTVPALAAGTIVETSPSINDVLTVTGSNETASATYQWQQSADGSTGWANIAGATAASLNTSTGVTENYHVRRQVTDGVQGPASTPGVQVVAGLTSPLDLGDDLIAWLDYGDTAVLYQNSNVGPPRTGNTPVATDGDDIWFISDKSARANNFRSVTEGSSDTLWDATNEQAHFLSNCKWQLSGATNFLAGGTVDGEIYASIVTQDTQWRVLNTDETAGTLSVVGNVNDTQTGSPNSVNQSALDSLGGVDLSGTPTRQDLFNAWTPDPCVIGMRNVDFTVFELPNLFSAADGGAGALSGAGTAVKWVVFTKLLTAQKRTQLASLMQNNLPVNPSP